MAGLRHLPLRSGALLRRYLRSCRESDQSPCSHLPSLHLLDPLHYLKNDQSDDLDVAANILPVLNLPLR